MVDESAEDTTDLQFDDYTDDFKNAVHRGLINAVEDISGRIAYLAAQNAPEDSGNLQRGIYSKNLEVSDEGARKEFGVEGVPYAAAVEYGSAKRGEPLAASYIGGFGDSDWPQVPPGKETWSKYLIKPIRAEVLHWKDGDGKDVFAHEVEHPGRKPDPYLRPAIDQVRYVEAPDIIKDSLRREIVKQLERVHTTE